MNRILLLVVSAVSLVAAGRITMNPDRVQGMDHLSTQDLQLQKFILDIVKDIRQPLRDNELIQLDQGLIVDSQRYHGGIDGEMQEVIELDRQRRLLDEHQDYSVARLEDVQQLRGIVRLLVRSQDIETLQRNVVYLRRNINPVLLVNALALAIRDREDSRNVIVPAVQELLPELFLDEEVIERVRGVHLDQSQRPTLMDIIGVRQQARNPLMNILMPWRDIHMQMALMRQRQGMKKQAALGLNRMVVNAENQGQIEGTSLLTDDIEMRNFVQNLIQELALQEQETQIQVTQDPRELNVNRGRQDQWMGGNQGERQEWSINRQRELGQDLDMGTGRLLRVNRRRLQEQQQQLGQSENIYGNQRERFQRVLRRDDDNDDDEDDDDEIRMGRVQLQRGISQGGIQGGVRDLPTVNVDSNRLLRVNRRRLNSIQQEQDQLTGRQRWMGLVRGERLSEGRRVGQQQQEEEGRQEWQRGQRINQDNDQDVVMQRQGRRLGQQQQEQEREQEQQSYADQLESVSRDNERLVHINRRRLNQIQNQNQNLNIWEQKQQQQQQQRIIPRRIVSIGEGRRVLGERPIQDEDILKLIRSEHRLQLMTDDEVLDMLKRNRQQRLEKIDNDDDNDDDDDDDNVVESRRGIRSRRSLSNLRQENNRRSEISLHNLRQLVARLNQETIAQGQMISQGQQQWINNPRQTQSERYGLRLNQIRIDSLRNREMLEKIGRIEERLQLAIGQVMNQVNINALRGQMEGQHQVESLIADILLGGLGQVGILDILRQLGQDNGQQMDRSGLGVRLSDPLVQHTLRRIVRIVDQQRDQILGSYRQEQLQMRGVTINDVRVDKLRTRIEEHDLDLSNLVEQEPQQQQQVILGRQRRLNNKDFTIDMDITSDRGQDGIIRVFLGPGQGATLEERRGDFVLLNAINVPLQTGRNRIQLRSIDIPWTGRDVTPLTEIYRRVMMHLNGQQELGVQELVGESGRFPQHLLLPRGRPEGLPMQLLVIVSPLIEDQQLERNIVPDISIGIGAASLQDIRPLGYPLDRPIINEQELLKLTNVQLQDVVIVQEN
ncbi:hypothetical protein KR009_008542 [Drosophila setifemur]|nr:hypothetical protein KR009_008542 [Drosophila setifemur]